MPPFSKNLTAKINKRGSIPPAHTGLEAAMKQLLSEGIDHGLWVRPWLALATATIVTVNSPSSLFPLYTAACSTGRDAYSPVVLAELIREVGLKCLAFNGIPKTINCLRQFRKDIPPDLRNELGKWPSRASAADNQHLSHPGAMDEASLHARGMQLWNSIYNKQAGKLRNELAQDHPDLPAVIVNHHYGALLADPVQRPVGRVLTSLVAVACLHQQAGAGPQVTSHLLGLRRGLAENGDGMEKWGPDFSSLVRTDDGLEWVLSHVEAIAKAVIERPPRAMAKL